MIRTRLAFVGLVSLVGVPLSLLAFACGGSQEAAGGAKGPGGGQSTVLAHEDCSESGNKVEVLDTNGDGKPDIRRIFNKGSGREICRIADLNHDGKPDLYEYYDPSGTVRRREYCYDDTGVVNAVEYYEGGKLVRREFDTTGVHRIDTWDTFDPGAPLDAKTGRPSHPIRRERDTTGDGKVDQWWTWDGDRVSIAVDTNNDGKPDPASVVVLDKNGAVATDSSASATAPVAPSAAPAASSAPAPAASTPAAPAADGGTP